MCWPALAACLLFTAAAPSGPADAGTPPAPDPELEMLATSLLPAQRRAVDRAVGGLDALPRYRIDVALDAERHFLTGREQIVLTPKEELAELHYRIRANAAFLDEGLGPAVQVARVACKGKLLSPTSLARGVYRISFSPPVPAGEQVVVEIQFAARIPDLSRHALRSDQQLMQQAMAFLSGVGSGLAQTDHGVFGHAGRAYNLVGFYPELVAVENGIPDVSAEPGQGDPRWGPLAHYTLSLVTPFGFEVAGTGREIGQTPEKDGRLRTTRVAAAVRGVALVAGEGWEVQKATAGGVRLRVIGPAGQGEQPRKLLDVARRAVGHFSSRFGPYPWTDLELASAPLHGGIEAVALPGLVIASPMLTDPGLAPAMAMLMPDATKVTDAVLEMSIAHQVSHQWWRGVVGSDALARPVLEEPLATYSALLYVEHRRGRKAARTLLGSQVRDAYRIHRMLGGTDLPVDRPMSEYRGRAEIVGLLNGKGALFYDGLRKLLGDKAFFAALRRHYKENFFGQLSADGVLLAAAAVAPAKAQAALELYERSMRGLHGDEDTGGPLDLAQALQGSGVQVDAQTRALLQQFGSALGAGGGGSAGGGIPVVQPPPPPQGGKQGP